MCKLQQEKNEKKKILKMLIEDTHNFWLYCFTNPFLLRACVSFSHRQPCEKHRLMLRKQNTCSKFKGISETI